MNDILSDKLSEEKKTNQFFRISDLLGLSIGHCISLSEKNNEKKEECKSSYAITDNMC